MKLFITLIGFFISAVASAAPGDYIKSASDVTADELNALVTLQPTTKGIYFSAAEVKAVSSEITKIKNQFSEVQQINDDAADAASFSSALMMLEPEVLTPLLPKITALTNKQLPSPVYISGKVDCLKTMSEMLDIKNLTNLVTVESANAHYSASAGAVSLEVMFFEIKMHNLINISALAKALNPLHEMRYLEGNGMIGDGNRIRRQVLDNQNVAYVFSKGSGDCPSGCTEWQNFRFKINSSTGEITKTGEDSDFPLKFN